MKKALFGIILIALLAAGCKPHTSPTAKNTPVPETLPTSAVLSQSTNIPFISPSTTPISTSTTTINSSININEAKVQFQNSKEFGFYGTLILTGYLDLEHWDCKQNADCERPSGDYASFILTNTSNKVFNQFLSTHTANTGTASGSIALGCFDKIKNNIYSYNIGDKGTYQNIISNTALDKLVNSSKYKPVNLQLTMPISTDSGQNPPCYSYFRYFKILSF